MNVLLTPEVLILFIEDILLLVFGTLAFFLSLKIYKYFNLENTTDEQYKLEKQTYLVSYIIKFSLSVKIISLLFFVFTLDKLAFVIPGAMCAVGVSSTSEYGIPLIIFKLINIFLFGFWLLVNKEDNKNENYPYTKIKYKYFSFIYFFLVLEILLQKIFFLKIDPLEIVSCCSTVFNDETITITGKLINIPNFILVPLFYLTFLFVVYSNLKKKILLHGIANFIFLNISLISLISFFGTYIYELPTHHCPFCILQGDYNFIGYILYTFLLIGTFYGIAITVLKYFFKIEIDYLKSTLIFNFLYVALVSFYPVKYYLVNGVWL